MTNNNLSARIRFTILVSVLISSMMVLFTGKSCAQVPFRNIRYTRIDSLIKSAISRRMTAGAVVQIAQNGHILYRHAYGYALEYRYDMKPVSKPQKMQVDDMFDLASLTKVFGTTFGIMELINQGKIHLDDPVSKYLPAFSAGAKKKITIRQLLNHTSGLNEWQPIYYHAKNEKETYRYICNLPLKYKVGAARHYSDLGFMMLGFLIEKVSGMPLDQYLETHIYHPLGLAHTVYNPLSHGFTKNMIAATSPGNPFEYKMVADSNFGYRCHENINSFKGWRHYMIRGQVSDGNAYYANNGVAGHAGLFSTAPDLQVLINLMLNKGSFNGRQFIKPRIIDEFTTKDRYGNGLGWDMDPDFIHCKGAPPDTYGHTGFTGTSVVIIPDYKLSILLLTNREHVGTDKAGYYPDLANLRQNIVDAVLAGR